MKKTMENHYRSKDLMLSAAFLAKGVPLLNTKDSGRYLVFYFDDPDKCQKIEQEWWSGTLEVKATEYASSIKRLKDLIYARR